MKPVLLIRNDRFETFGVAPGALATTGLDVLTVNTTVRGTVLPDLEDVAGVVTFGGTVNVDQVDDHPSLSAVRGYTRDALDAGVPYLGICLGSQILARALDVDVVRGPVREVGFELVHPTSESKSDALLSFLEQDEMVMHWHEDTHDLPADGTLLAAGDRIPLQAYRVGDLAWGVQFHLEVDAFELAWWLELADAEIDILGEWGKSAEQIRAESERHISRQEERGREIFRRFAEVVRATAGT